MKQYTTPDQTAKLIGLGFERPKSYTNEASFLGCGYTYSIGELIEMLPHIIRPIPNDFKLYCRKIIGVSVEYSFDDPFGNTPALYLFYQYRELIDNLFDAVVKLKEEGVI